MENKTSRFTPKDFDSFSLGWGPEFKRTTISDEPLKAKRNTIGLTSIAHKCSLMGMLARKISREVP